MALIRTMSAYDYSTVDDRVWSHPGWVVDLGCLGWDWSQIFLSKKKVIGADPFGQPIDGALFYPGMVGPVTGTGHIRLNGDASTTVGVVPNQPGVHEFPTLSWKDFCQTYSISSVSILKLNIEGGEYDLLSSLQDSDFDQIDQVVVSFHCWINPGWAPRTQEAVDRLKSLRYSHRKLDTPYGWHLFLKS